MMQIVIDIPEHICEHAKERSEDSRDEFEAMRAIANGTPLPKGHGELIDKQILIDDIVEKICLSEPHDWGRMYGMEMARKIIAEAETIIPAEEDEE